jgi:hypothetical protein
MLRKAAGRRLNLLYTYVFMPSFYSTFLLRNNSIHCNPVKDGFISHPADWPYSNYLEWIGARDGTLFDLDFVREHFPNPGEYKTFVLDYLESRFVPPDVRVYLQELGKN